MLASALGRCFRQVAGKYARGNVINCRNGDVEFGRVSSLLSMGLGLSRSSRSNSSKRHNHRSGLITPLSSSGSDEPSGASNSSNGMAPIQQRSGNAKNPVQQQLQQHIDSHVVTIFSKSYCPYCTEVKSLFDSINVEYFVVEFDKEEEGELMQHELADMSGQRTVPNVYINGVHLGGCDDTKRAHREARLQTMLDNVRPKYDYDLIVIGGGSGGLAASKEAALKGARVAVFDFVKPTPIGTQWGLGGTCVNVGCIPKKLMHQAAILGHSMHDAKKFGWNYSDDVSHNWETMKDGIQGHIGSLNWGYRVQLREKKVTYLNAYAEFVAPHTIKATDKKGKETQLTAENFIVATGLRPKYPDIPGDREFGITSDDLFSMPYSPGKTCVVGASYVALECAGFLRGIGLEVVILVRSILLRGFDQDMSERIGANLEEQGIRLVRECLPTKVERLEEGEPGRIMVTATMSDGSLFEEEFNTILFAIGREARTEDINAPSVGLELNPKNGKIIAENERSNVDYIYGIGDILDGKPELTPVAIQAGKLLAKRLYGGSTVQCDYLNIPTTVFTPLEYGCCGYSEEEAIAKFGEENIEVYHSNFWPLEYTVPKRAENDCYIKVVCLIPEKERVIGFHYLGPNAGEITQGFGLGVRMGATKDDFDALIGIHPTCAEMFTTLTTTKRSGVDVKASGC